MKGVLLLIGFGIDETMMPASTISIFICLDGLIATIAGPTLAFRTISSSIAYAFNHDVWVNKFLPDDAITNTTAIAEAIAPMGTRQIGSKLSI